MNVADEVEKEFERFVAGGFVEACVEDAGCLFREEIIILELELLASIHLLAIESASSFTVQNIERRGEMSGKRKRTSFLEIS